MGKFTEETCFAINSMGECSALVKTQCENCKFFKTREQVEKERRKAITRLKGLNGGTYYLQKYHPDEVKSSEERQATK